VNVNIFGVENVYAGLTRQPWPGKPTVKSNMIVFTDAALIDAKKRVF
jgi:hypothetical protein